jgi:flagellar hook-basal body complex protein FliE
MTTINVNSVLSQIRAMQTQIGPTPAVQPAAAQQQGGFDKLLTSAIGQVNAAQQESSRLQTAFASGDANTDLSSVMIAGAKAQVQFKGMVEVRNRLVSAYQDIMNMPI